jgi:hypothetical protein
MLSLLRTTVKIVLDLLALNILHKFKGIRDQYDYRNLPLKY